MTPGVKTGTGGTKCIAKTTLMMGETNDMRELNSPDGQPDFFFFGGGGGRDGEGSTWQSTHCPECWVGGSPHDTRVAFHYASEVEVGAAGGVGQRVVLRGEEEGETFFIFFSVALRRKNFEE